MKDSHAPDRPLHLLGIAGSLRKLSYNRALLQVAVELAPPGVRIELVDLRGIPFYDGDIDVDGGPEPVRDFKRRIGEADGLLLATPEYNYGIPGVLKNALDWASRPAYRSVLAHKPVAVLGAAGSAVGTARAQGQLKQVLLGTLSEVYPAPELVLGGAKDKFDASGKLTDEKALDSLTRLLTGFAAWTRRRLVERP